ncbi:MAG: hypothetical protein BWY67_01951 [Bacteroidetes bacterium ADurb.Bin397]|nr:MAG: hypothetical protein BWY67_01951 [Bacteroidetes bacterium ADurb.Bin397]
MPSNFISIDLLPDLLSLNAIVASVPAGSALAGISGYLLSKEKQPVNLE